ncbi:hypothetical protein [Serratia quinivorans]|uniref:DUF5983 family protein n=1 Tax=Serratia quinivorans TaxID=137545 RepID=UPI0034C62942
MAELLLEDTPRVAVISTAHVTENDAEILPTLCWDNRLESGYFWIQATGGGWLLRLDRTDGEWSTVLADNAINPLSIESIQRLELAGYQWVLFDAGAQLLDGFPWWEW